MQKILTITILTLLTLTTFTTAQNISDIQASFCVPNQSEREIDLVTKSNQLTDICIKFQNNSPKDNTIALNFTDGALTPQGSKACLSPEKPKTNFGQYIQDYTDNITISGGSNIEQHYKIKYPVGFSGVSHGCLGYYIQNKDEIGGGVGLVFRKTHSIDILVGGTEINSNLLFQNITITGDQASNRITIDLINNGNINQEITISGTISNIFGYQQDFTTQPTTLLANSKTTISTDKLNIPDYKGLFKINTNIDYIPIFNFDITNHNIPTKYISPGTIVITKSIILRNWFYIIGLSLISILISINIIKYIKLK